MALDYEVVDAAGDTVLTVRHLWASEPPDCCMCGKPVLELRVPAVAYYEGPCRSGQSEGGHKPACMRCYTRWARWDDAETEYESWFTPAIPLPSQR